MAQPQWPMTPLANITTQESFAGVQLPVIHANPQVDVAFLLKTFSKIEINRELGSIKICNKENLIIRREKTKKQSHLKMV